MLAISGCAGDKGDTGPAGPAGATGAKGDTGQDGDPGADGKDAVTIGDVTGTVTDGTNPIADVDVTVDPGTATGKTAADGTFSLKGLDIGSYLVTFKATGYLDQTVVVGVKAGGTTDVKVSLGVDSKSQVPPTVTTTDNLLAGFGKSVTLKATATGKGTLSYQWTQTEGPTVTLTGDKTDTITFTTQTLMNALPAQKVANARFGMLGINPDEAGNYVFEVAVTDSATGLTTKSDVKVNATRPTAGLRMLPLGIPQYLQGDGSLVNAAQTTWNWTLDASGATGSTATITNPTSQFPVFTPDKKGIYKITETVSKKTMTLYGGTWIGEMTPDGTAPSATCGLCHTGVIAPDNFTPWKNTRHFKGLSDKLDGVTTKYFPEECMSCHTVGYDKTANNGGFDDLEADSGWTMPTKLEPGNWDTLVNNAKVGPLAGIQCESCHGPQAGPTGGPHTSSTGGATCTKDADCTSGANGLTGLGLCQIPSGQTSGKCLTDTSARISLATEVCANCHQEKPYHYKPGQWYSAKHSDLELAYLDATVETRGTTAAHCGRCHTAQGYTQYVAQLKQGYSGNLTSDGKPASGTTNAATIASLTKLGLTQATVQSQTCASCHDPHDSSNPAQLRIYDSVQSLPNGMANISGLGSGMVCVTCHNTRNGEHSDFVAAPTSFTAPHAAAQSDVVFGFNAYFMPRYNPSAHLAVKDSCAGCHYGVATDAQMQAKEDKNHSFKVDATICQACHSSNVDGEGLKAANEMQLLSLGKAISGKIGNLIANALLPANGGQYTVRVWDPVTDYYSSVTPAAASNIIMTAAPTSIELFEVHGQAGVILHMAAPVTGITLYDAKNNLFTSTFSTSDVYLQLGNLRNATATAPLFAASSDYMKAIWNYSLLHGDNTAGIHNPTFFNNLIAATNAKLNALP